MNSNRQFRPQVIKDKRKHLIDVIHEHEADEDLLDYFGLGKAPKE